MSLNNAPKDILLRINEINLDDDLKRKLISMGIQVDDVLLKLNDNRWGAVLVKNVSNSSSKIALAKDLAENIIVQYGN